MGKLYLDKGVMAILHQISVEAKEHEEAYAITGILYVKKDKPNVICGCAFPARAYDGCQVSGYVTKLKMAKIYASIYKNGYIPVGMVIIQTGCTGEYPYGGVGEDRRHGFVFVTMATEGWKCPLLMVIDDEEKGWIGRSSILTRGIMPAFRKMTSWDLTKKKGGVTWISHDNWVYLTLKSMGIKLLP
jgi:hypothetical protein